MPYKATYVPPVGVLLIVIGLKGQKQTILYTINVFLFLYLLSKILRPLLRCANVGYIIINNLNCTNFFMLERCPQCLTLFLILCRNKYLLPSRICDKNASIAF